MNEEDTLKEFRSKFRVEELLVYKSKFWSWSVRPNQPTLGSGILSLNRYALHLSDVSEVEMADLSNIISKLEKSTKEVFGHNIMNYLMLMMVDHHVHYHVIPRYDGVRSFSDLEWVDNGWPAMPVLSDSQHKDKPEVVLSIRETLVSSII